MRHQLRGVSLSIVAAALVSIVWWAAPPAAGQQRHASAAPYRAPRTADGQPDLQGTWANNNVTPLERPQAFGTRQLLTDEELATLKARESRLFSGEGDAAFGDTLFQTLLSNPDKFVSTDGKTGDYNQFWLPDRVWDNRTSLIVDPPDGRIPALTPPAQRRQAEVAASLLRLAQGPEDRGLSERCITFGVPRVQAAYMSYYQIVQSRDYVVIAMETIHDARVIPLDGRPHVNSRIRNWLGDSRGHWESDTLVVDTTNFSPASNFRGSHENLHLVERLTRLDRETLKYEFTVDDATTWVRPWSVMIPLRLSRAPMFEYACHEGNLGLAGILAGARAEEKSD